MRGAAVREHFGAYAHENFVDEPYLTAKLTVRTRLPSMIVSDAVVSHFQFFQQQMPDQRAILERYRHLSKNISLHRQLANEFGGRGLSLSCPKTPPAALMQGSSCCQTSKPNATKRREGVVPRDVGLERSRWGMG